MPEMRTKHMLAGDSLAIEMDLELDLAQGAEREASGFTSRKYRDMVAKYASGITVISGWHQNAPIGFTCQSFYSVSLDPALVSISVMTSSSTYPRLRETGRFAVNVLADGQQGVSDRFAQSGTDKWSGVSWSPSPQGMPVIDGVIAWLDCEIREEYPAGDHIIVVGEVLALGTPEVDEPGPLIFFEKSYRRLGINPPNSQQGAAQ